MKVLMLHVSLLDCFRWLALEIIYIQLGIICILVETFVMLLHDFAYCWFEDV